MTQATSGRLFGVTLPRIDGKILDFDIYTGEILFVLGANGTGKSAFIQHLASAYSTDAIRMSAHRQTWLESSTVDLTPQTMLQQESEARREDARPQSRWRGRGNEVRPRMAIFNLINSEIPRLREIRDAARAGDDRLVHKLADEDSPLEKINHLLQLSNLSVAISIADGEEIRAERAGLPAYTMAEMSDGERSAVLIAAEILTAEPGKLFLIDEPERHLHRSIITPLLRSLIWARSDCTFVISTHEVGLPLDFPDSKALLVRGCQFMDGRAVSWHADLLEPPHSLDEQLHRDVLGSRRKVLFVEGKATGSLDQPLYGLLFPDFSIVAKGGSNEVVRSVKGLRNASDIAWVEAFGIVDRDNRDNQEVEDLSADGVFALDWYSVESIYYHPETQRRVAERRAAAVGGNAAADLWTARRAALNRIRQGVDRIVEKRTTARARRRAQESIPTDLNLDSVLTIPSIDVPALRDEERAEFEQAIADADLEAIVQRYPIRETGALDAIAKGLGFQSRSQYERAVLKLLSEDQESLEWVRSRFEPLTSAFADSDNTS